MADDLGKRIAAARAYAGISQEVLADGISLTIHAVQRLEAGVEDLSESDRWSVIRAVAASTRLPDAFFTADFDSLIHDEPPEQKLDRLEHKIDQALERMDQVVAEADRQMTRGKEQLDRFVQAQERDRDLHRKIAEQLGIKPTEP
jgi:transcriptional regulator with XRE-family HTH domain